MRVAIVTGAIAPYTHRLYEAFARTHTVDLTVLVCGRIEPQRQWRVPPPEHYRLQVLSGLRRHVSYTRHVYFNPSVLTALARLRPDTIVIEDFSPTMALAAAYARATGTPYGIKTDGHRGTDPGERSRIHHGMRRLLVPSASFGICASEDSVALLEHWGLDAGRSVIVPIVTPWDAPDRVPAFTERRFDTLFAGALNEDIKGAGFFVDVVEAVVCRGLKPLVRVTGDGPLRAEMAARLARLGVTAQFDGPLQPPQMPDVYGSARLLLFPSRGDAWGLVANEAAFCGTPVIGSPQAISSQRLVERYNVGVVRPLDVGLWADAVMDMLSSEAQWHGFTARRGEVIADFSLDASVARLARALDATHDRAPPGRGP